jgi:sugar lactone lactonase YvrE
MKKILIVAFVTASFASCKKNDLSPVTSQSEMLATASPKLERVYEDSVYLLTGVAASSNGRLFTNYPLWQGPHKYDVVEITSLNDRKPYPDAMWNSWKEGDDGKNKWVCVQAVYVDDENYLWVVDPASPKMGGVYKRSYKLVKINLATDGIEKIYRFTMTADENSYVNDVRVDTKNGYAYLTNSNEGGIVVVNLSSGNMRQVLQGNSSVISDPDYVFNVEGKEFKTNYGAPVKINSDGIALTPDGKYIYYKPITDDWLYRIETKYLQDFSMSLTKIASKVENLGRFTTTDGMIFDKQGNLYLGDIENSRIMKIAPNLSMSVLIQDKRLSWPDSYSIANGYLYISCSQLQQQPKYNTGTSLPSRHPYTIYRLLLQ